MANNMPLVVGGAVVLLGIVLLAKKDPGDGDDGGNGGAECLLLTPGPYHYLRYIGPTKPWYEAIGPCYNVIFTLDLWDPISVHAWEPITQTNLVTGVYCRIMVLSPCEVCNFEPGFPV